MRKIAIFGLAGIHNLGNECTLEIVAEQLSSRLPEAEIFCISYDPEETSSRHGLKALPIRDSLSEWLARGQSDSILSRVVGIFRKIFLRAPLEFASWLRAANSLRGTDTILMAGTGMLTDFGSKPFGLPWDVLKWVSAARLVGCRVVFVSVGVGPLYGKLSRFIFQRALSMAYYVSYRDQFSKEKLESLGFDTEGHVVVPDSVFSWALDQTQISDGAAQRRPRVGLGVINYFDEVKSGEENRAAIAAQRLRMMSEFVARLVDKGFDVRILCQDLIHDPSIKNALKKEIERKNVQLLDRIFDDETDDASEFISLLQECDVLVTSRFHTLLFGIMLAKPVISLSYEPKNDALLASVGMEDYCHDLDDLEMDELVSNVLESHGRRQEIRNQLTTVSLEFKSRLERQYDELFGAAPAR